jgi:hypothetical protein
MFTYTKVDMASGSRRVLSVPPVSHCNPPSHDSSAVY